MKDRSSETCRADVERVYTEVEKALGVAPPETISIDPERPLYEACRRMLQSRARRIPLVTADSQTDRSHVLSVVTQYRILKFVAVNVGDTQKLRRPLGELLIGSYDNVATASMDTSVIDVIHILVERSISSVPILNSEGAYWTCCHKSENDTKIFVQASCTMCLRQST